MRYGPALEAQRAHHEGVLEAHEAGERAGGEVGRILTVEHEPVITVTRRPGVAGHLLATPDLLQKQGVEVHETDRGGDITYHGPGQQVVYPIVDLKRTGLRVIEYIRLLEQAVIETIAPLGLEGRRDPEATGVWVTPREGGPPAKVCAIGVRVRKWVTLHGLAVNVRTDLSHFGLIVPCGLSGRPVTSLERELGEVCPGMEAFRVSLAGVLRGMVLEASRGPGPGRG